MLLNYRSVILAIQALSLQQLVLAGPHNAKHEFPQRQPSETSTTTIAPETSIITYTMITPSRSASPIAVTSMSQVVTTYIPIITMCAISLVPITLTPKYGNSSTRYANASYSVSSSLGEGCTTYYNTTSTTVCATVLTGIATSYNITGCKQDVTFSTAYGYRQTYDAAVNSSAYTGILAPIETVTSMWIAPWQALTSGLTPENITQKVCSYIPATATASAGEAAPQQQECVDSFESWVTFVVASTTSSTSHVDLTTTIAGPSQVIIETFHADVTATMTVFSISTVLVLEYSTETTMTSTSTLDLNRPYGQSDLDVTTSTEPGDTSTITVEARKTA